MTAHELSSNTRPAWVIALLLLILALYVTVGTLFAVRTPAWQAPDEPAHYNYVAQVASNGCCPVIAMGDWDSAYLEAMKASRFAPETLARLDTVQYEDHQPPLYYVLLAPVYALTNGSLNALRIASVIIGALIVISAFGVGRVMFPQRPQIALGAAAFVAFLPQHIAILASVNNDALGWALAALILWAAVAHVKGVNRVRPWILGVLVGIGLVTKATVYLMAGVALLAVLMRWWLESPRDWAALMRRLTAYLIPALILGGLWWARNISVYGFPDFLGLAAHDSVVVGQPRTEDLIARRGMGAYLSEALDVTFSSFIGRFGWMALPLVGGAVGWIYPAFALLFGVGGAGAVMGLRRVRESSTAQRMAWVLIGVTGALAVLAYLYYNTEFVQFQGRYMYPLLTPLGIVLALGLDQWRMLAVGEQRARWLVPLIFMALAVLDVWLLWTVIAPNL